MAAPTEIFEVFLTPMKRLFARPPHGTEEDESAALAQYLDALKPYSKTTLENAWKDVRNSQTGRFWPPVAVCLKACRLAREIETTHRKSEHPRAVSGRMVDGAWQPWVGCQCERCRRQEAFRRAEDVQRWGRGSMWYREAAE